MTQFKIEDETYEMVQDKLTFGEARAVEKVTGHTFAEIGVSKSLQSSNDVIQAMVWISMKRVNPTLTFTDLDDMAIDSIEWISDEEINEVRGEDPTRSAEFTQDDAEFDEGQTLAQAD